MASQTEKRTLEIVAQLRDQMSPTWKTIGSTVATIGKQMGRGFVTLGKQVFSLRTGIVGLLAAFAGRAVFNHSRDVAQAAAEYDLWAQKLGTSVEELDRLAFAAEQVVGPRGFEVISEGLKTLQERLDDGAQGTRSIADQLERLGIQAVDPTTGRLKNAVQVVDELALAYQRLKDEGRLEDLVLISEDLLGGTESVLSVMLQQGPEAIAVWKQMADQFGVITERQARAGVVVRNAFGAMARAVTSVKRAFLETFGPDIAALLRTIGRVLVENRDEIVRMVADIARFIVATVREVYVTVRELFRSIIEFANRFGLGFQTTTEKSRRRVVDLKNDIAALEDRIENMSKLGIPALTPGGIEGLFGDLELLREQLANEEQLLAVRQASEESSRGLGERIEELIEKTRRLFAEEQKRAAAAVDGTVGAPSRAATPRGGGDTRAAVGRELDAIRRDAAGLQAELDGARLVLQRAEQTREVLATVNELDRMQARIDIFNALSPAIQAGTADFQDLAVAIQASEAAFDKAAARIEGSSIWVGLQDGIKRTIDAWMDLTAAADRGISNVIDTSLSGLSSAISDGVTKTKSWKDAFKELGATAVKALTDMASELLVINFVRGLFGSGGLFGGLLAEGGVTKGVAKTVPMRRFAEGGVAREPTFALFGEAGEEAFVPLKHGRIPVALQGAGAGAPSFTFNISAIDGQSVRKMLLDEKDAITSIVMRGIQHKITVQDGIRGAR